MFSHLLLELIKEEETPPRQPTVETEERIRFREPHDRWKLIGRLPQFRSAAGVHETIEVRYTYGPGKVRYFGYRIKASELDRLVSYPPGVEIKPMSIDTDAMVEEVVNVEIYPGSVLDKTILRVVTSEPCSWDEAMGQERDWEW